MAEAEIELKPCPFCGESAGFDGTEFDVSIQCDACLATGPIATTGCRDDEDIDLKAEAAELWNRRAPLRLVKASG